MKVAEYTILQALQTVQLFVDTSIRQTPGFSISVIGIRPISRLYGLPVVVGWNYSKPPPGVRRRNERIAAYSLGVAAVTLLAS